MFRSTVLLLKLLLCRLVGSSQPWEAWLTNFGHDAYHYPAWVAEQKKRCSCHEKGSLTGVEEDEFDCYDSGVLSDWKRAEDLTWCVASHYLLNHMPEFDLHFLPNSVSIDGDSMLDDNIAFALMAWNVSKLSPKPPMAVALSYFLSYASLHESRNNWRPIFFAKYINSSVNLTTSRAILDALIGGRSNLMNWTQYSWSSFPGAKSNRLELGPFASGSSPPVVGPFDFAAYGYGSCTAWATFLTSALKAVGVPARQAGSPCWNTIEFAGLATANPNVSYCWSGGVPDGPSGGKYLNNHNWVEYWDNQAATWKFVDVATSSSEENTWFCGTYSDDYGCECTSNAGKAALDHPILSMTWTKVSEGSAEMDGGEVLDVSTDLRLTTGEAVSPLVWAPRLKSPLGKPLKNVGLRVVNRTSFYRCKPSPMQPKALIIE